MSEWKTVRLGDVCEIQSGGTPSRSKTEYWKNGTIPWVKIGDFSGKYLNKTTEHITQKGLENSSAKLFSKGTILYSIFATLGEATILNIDATTNQAIAGIKIKDKSSIDIDYLFAYLKSLKEEVNRIGRGVAQNNINLSILKSFTVPLPPLETQKQIAKQLNKCTTLLAKHKQMLEKYDTLIKSRFIEMFGDIRNQEKYKGIPLSNLCKTMTGGTPPTSKPEYYEGTIPWITTVSLGPNHIDGKNAKGYITEEAIKNSATKLIPVGNILFGTRVGVGKSSINDVDICTNQDIIALIGIDESRYSKLFIKHVLDQYQPYFDSIKKGATILGITTDDVKKSLIPDVSLSLQKEFENFVQQIDKSKFAVQKSLEKAETLYKSLMQEYFG